jgi:hypothetical protein
VTENDPREGWTRRAVLRRTGAHVGERWDVYYFR